MYDICFQHVTNGHTAHARIDEAASVGNNFKAPGVYEHAGIALNRPLHT